MSNKKIAAELLKVAKSVLAEDPFDFSKEIDAYKKALAAFKKLENDYKPEEGVPQDYIDEVKKVARMFRQVAADVYTKWKVAHSIESKIPTYIYWQIATYCGNVAEQLFEFASFLTPKIYKFPSKIEDFFAPPMP